MKNKFSMLAAVLVATALTLNACKKDEKTSTEEVQNIEQVSDATVFEVNKDSSKIEWKGYKVFKSEETSHFGTMNFSEGELGVKDNQLVSGKFVADIQSLKTTDLEGEAAEKLNGHLKADDFFGAEKFPTATFEISKVTPLQEGDYNTMLEGNLTIKGITKSTSFKANVKIEDELVSVSTEPTDFDRSLFDVKFQSPVENGVIKNEITLQVMVKANLKK